MGECIIRNIKIHVEVPVGLILFASTLTSALAVNFMEYRICYLILGYNQSECALLGMNYSDNVTSKIEEEVQPHASVLQMTLGLIGSPLPVILAFFMGPWSDKYGRRPVILSSLTGLALSSFILPIVSMLPDASPWLLLIGSIPVSLFGGYAAFMTVCACYIIDVTSEENRGVRMSILDAVMSIGILSATLISSYAFNALGYTIVFALSSCCNILALIFALLFIPESVPQQNDRFSIISVFDFKLVTSVFQTTFKSRESYTRAVLLLIILSMMFFMFALFGDNVVMFFFLREKFHWSLTDYMYFSTGYNVAFVLGNLFGVAIFHKLLHINELPLMILGSVSTMVSALFRGLAVENWNLYAAVVVISFGGIVRPMSKSLVSKLIASEEIGKVFSLITALSSITDLISEPTYTYVYNATLETKAGAFNFVSTGIYLFNTILTIFIMKLKRFVTIGSYEQLPSSMEQSS